MTCTDHYATGENFDVYMCDSCGFIFTQNAPCEAEIGRYYDSPDYISHSNTHKGLMNKVYHWVRQYMLISKAHLIKHHSGLSREYCWILVQVQAILPMPCSRKDGG